MTTKTTSWVLATLALTGALAGGLACIPEPGEPQTYEEAVFALVPTTTRATVDQARSLAEAFCASGPDLAAFVQAAEGIGREWNATLTTFEAPMPFGDVLPEETLPETLEERANASVSGLVAQVEALPGPASAPPGAPPPRPVRDYDIGLVAQASFAGANATAPTTRSFASPGEAGRALMAQAGETPTEEDLAELARLDGLQEPVRGAATRLLSSLLALDEAVAALQGAAIAPACDALAARLAAFDRKDASALDALDAALPAALVGELGVDLSRLLGARRGVVESAMALDELVETALLPDEEPAPSAPASLASGGMSILSGRCRFFKVDFSGADTYSDDYRVLLEFGGSDTYHNNAGGNHCGDGCEVKPWAFAMDFKGSDTYGDLSSRMDCGINGGAYVNGGVGVGFLMDLGKADPNDRYYAGKKGTNGGAFSTRGVAVGFVYDHQGDDTYDATDYGANGGAASLLGVSVALAFDHKGNDVHRAGNGGVNGGAAGPISLALHSDGDGNDRYEAGKLGVNGGAIAGALGILLDAGGDDRYDADSFAVNGGGAVVGFAFLLDNGGNDVYDAGGTAANGGAALVALGWLRDAGGNDRYEAGSIAANGGATLLALGFLTDRGAGSDRYQAFDIATNGGGVLLGFGHVRDEGGNDVHEATHLATNGGAFLLATGALRGLSTGADFYNATGTATNGGGFLVARGRLLDGGGPDSYRAAGFATNGGAAIVAWGNVVDDGGDDRYAASDVATNGGGFLVAWGRILDHGGNDRYDAGECGVNGGACYGGNGTLLDFGGHDVYQSLREGANGGGYGVWPLPPIYSKGLLVDIWGDDQYLARSADGASGSDGFNGGGAFFGIGFLRDEAGNDTYDAIPLSPLKEPGRGSGDCGVNGGACWQGDGVIMDLGTGNDTYHAGSLGVNGGIYNTARQGTLVDQCGRDRYDAEGTVGANGGAAWNNIFLDDMGSGKLVDMGGVGDSYAEGTASALDATRTRKPNYHGDQLDSGPVPCPYTARSVVYDVAGPLGLPIGPSGASTQDAYMAAWVASTLRRAAAGLSAHMGPLEGAGGLTTEEMAQALRRLGGAA